MISHCCASCGRPLDASSRVWLHGLRMWVARCPRCGHAVRWNPRGAREPIRVWARLRALNLRLGIAVSCAQAAGLASLAIGSLLLEYRGVVVDFGSTTRQARSEFVLYFSALGCGAALMGALSAMCLTPARPMPARVFLGWLIAWLVGALPVMLVIGLMPLAAGDDILRRLTIAYTDPRMFPRTILLCGAVPLLSLLLAWPLAGLWNIASRFVLRLHRSRIGGTLAPALPTPKSA